MEIIHKYINADVVSESVLIAKQLCYFNLYSTTYIIRYIILKFISKKEFICCM